MRMRTILRVMTVMAATAVITGCVSVDPRPDYARAGRLIRERTAADAVYDPAEEEHAAEQVHERLADGLTVDEAVDVALLNSPSLRASFQALGASCADVVQAGLLTNPSLSFGMQFAEGGGRPKLNLGFAQQVADLWQIPVRKKIAEANLEQVLSDVAGQGLAIAAEARRGCYRLLAAKRVLTIVRDGRDLAERARTLAHAQLQAGEVSRLDVSLARVAVLNIDQELLGLERAETAARLELARTLGLSRVDTAWELNGELPRPKASLPDDADLVAAALLQRFDARSAMAQVNRAEEELSLEYLKVLPDVTLGVDFERPEQRSLPGRKILADTVRSSIGAGQLTAPSIQSRGERRLEKSQIVDSLLGPSLTITLPLWDQNQAQIAKAKSIAKGRRHELEAVLDSIVTDVRQAAATARAARAQVTLYEQSILPEANANASLALDLYQAGEENILALLSAQESQLRFRQSYIEVWRDYATAIADLELALGGRIDTIGVGAADANDAPNEEKH